MRKTLVIGQERAQKFLPASRRSIRLPSLCNSTTSVPWLSRTMVRASFDRGACTHAMLLSKNHCVLLVLSEMQVRTFERVMTMLISRWWCLDTRFRSLSVVDDMFCMFQGNLENWPQLRQQYGLSRSAKTANETSVVIEMYRSLRDRAPYPADQAVRALQGSFVFVLFDSTTRRIFAAAVSRLASTPVLPAVQLHSMHILMQQQAVASLKMLLS